MSAWYVIHSKPQKEFALQRELIARNIEVYCPAVKVKPVNPRSRKIRPYFPGYLFVRVDIKEVGFSALQWLPFSLGFVLFDHVPASIPDGLINFIHKKIEDINLSGDFDSVSSRYNPGDKVNIHYGPFTGYEAIFDSHLSSKDRVIVLLKLVSNAQVPLEIPTGYLA